MRLRSKGRKNPACRISPEKLWFRDRIAAELALAALQRPNGGWERREKAISSVYRCPSCRGWHLTSRSRRGR
ncbi:hypothetical protein GCM10022221_23670 [Actinocorallia aurea]